MRYYIAEKGQPSGPFEAAELLAHGLNANSLVWGEGMAGWTSASQVPELAALLSGQPIDMGSPIGIDTQLPQMPPMGEVNMPNLPEMPPMGEVNTPSLPEMPPMGEVNTPGLPQMPPFEPQQPTPTDGGSVLPNPLPFPDSQPNTTPTGNRVMPKTWQMEAILVTVLSALCACNVFSIGAGIIAIIKSRGVSAKYAQGDYAGATAASASAKKWVIIAAVLILVVSAFHAFQIMNGNYQQFMDAASIFR